MRKNKLEGILIRGLTDALDYERGEKKLKTTGTGLGARPKASFWSRMPTFADRL
jgi:hypothetical protein